MTIKLSFSLIIILSSCGTHKSDGQKNENQKNDVYSDSIIGRWESSCVNSKISKIEFTNTTFVHEKTSYSDSNCVSPLLSATDKSIYFIIKDTNKINFTSNSYFFKIWNDTYLDLANSRKYYGLNNWKIGVDQEITGRKFSPSSNVSALNSGEKYFQIFEIEKNTLRFGLKENIHNGKTEETRPVEINESISYLRKL